MLSAVKRRFATFALIATLTACLTGCSGLSLLNAIAPSRAQRIAYDVSYADGARHKLDIWGPAHTEVQLPVVIFFYGGAWQSGNREHYRFVADALAPHGYIVVIPDYRVYPPSKFPTFIKDGAMTVAWVRENIAQYGGDPQRINLMGHSAGAYIVAMLTLNERYLNAVGLELGAIRSAIGLSGPYDFLPITEDDIEAVFSSAHEAANTQPINFVDGNEPPMLLAAGSDDKRVNPGNTKRLGQRIRFRGGRARVIIYPGASHVDTLMGLATPFAWPTPTERDVVNFLQQYYPRL